ncbi:MAG: glycosyltransferase [Deltaproteobacteria bacterium]|nr:glycosyltransferase [Deltaproteobacteria bacterium]
MTPASIALVVIVRNEADRIVSFIDNHAALVDEIIILDTGSSDDTISLASATGATVHQYVWDDDFSAARNAALNFAKSNYALCIDADERIADSDFSRLREAASRPGQCYVMPQRNYYNDPRHPEWQPLKGEYPKEETGQSGFFEARNTKFFDLSCGLQFEERVHESVIESANRNYIPIVWLDVPIHHYGYVISEQHNLARHTRYLSLLERKYRENPDDIKTTEEYATQLIQMGNANLAIPLLTRLDAVLGANSHVARGRLLLAQLKKAQGKAAEAEALFLRAVKNAPDYLYAHVQLLRHLADEKKFVLMAPWLDDALARFGEDAQLLQVQSRYLIETRQIHDAARVTRKVAMLYPSLPEYAQLATRCEALSRKIREMESTGQGAGEPPG